LDLNKHTNTQTKPQLPFAHCKEEGEKKENGFSQINDTNTKTLVPEGNFASFK